MRSQLWLLAAWGRLASANGLLGQKLDHPVDVSHLLPRETQASAPDGANGWTPKPTEGPSLELVRRSQRWANLKRQTSENTWLNDKTCGWFSEERSSAFTCPPSQTCATNRDQVIDCTSAGDEDPFSTFFTVCFDYRAFQNGACESYGPKTGCCQTESLGECITYSWPGSPERSMFRCFSERMVITMLDTPAALSTTSSTSTSSRSTSTTSEEETSTSTTDSAGEETESSEPNPSPSGGGSNTGAIVGGAVGGVAGLALIAGAIAYVIIRSRRNKAGNVGGGTAYSAVAPGPGPGGDTAYPGSPMPPSVAGYPPPPSSTSPQMSQAGGYYNPSTFGGNSSLQPPDTPYLNSPTPPVPGGAAYNTNAYYDPPKPADQPHPAGFAPSPHSSYLPYPNPGSPPPQGTYPGAYPPQQHQMSELGTVSHAGGQHGNPVEMPADQPTQR
ncbi:hypothetical protein P885DRAFT_41243 [Corynascus similis CBS 632.67]